tara:strand:- start:76 stop:504 length:429 start_codon:yes stop_codon:yes gene_type:complete
MPKAQKARKAFHPDKPRRTEGQHEVGDILYGMVEATEVEKNLFRATHHYQGLRGVAFLEVVKVSKTGRYTYAPLLVPPDTTLETLKDCKLSKKKIHASATPVFTLRNDEGYIHKIKNVSPIRKVPQLKHMPKHVYQWDKFYK